MNDFQLKMHTTLFNCTCRYSCTWLV